MSSTCLRSMSFGVFAGTFIFGIAIQAEFGIRVLATGGA